MSIVVALLLPLLPGLALWWYALGRPRGLAACCAALGTAWLLGAVALGVMLRGAGSLPVADWYPRLAPWVFVVSALLLVHAAWRARQRPVLCAPAATSRRGERALSALLLAMLAGHAITVTVQALSQPTLAWDAWTVWMAKPKAWAPLDRLLPFVDFEAWWTAPDGSARYGLAGHYPEALPRFVAWLGSAAGGYREPVAHAPWPLLWLALGAVLFGQLRLLGARPVLALGSAFAVLSLPLLNAHVALAGYADLWLAAVLLLALVHLIRAARLRARGDLLLAVVAMLLLPAIKLEGAVWLLCLLAGVALALLPSRWQRRALLALPLVWLAALPFGGLRVPLPGLGLVVIDWGSIVIPAMGTLPLYWRPVADEVATSLFLLPNWHLLWYLLPALLLLRWRRALGTPELRAGLYFLGFGYGFLAVLFFLTDASAWAENLTSINRVLLQVVPATVFWLSCLWRTPPAVRGRAT